MVFWLIVVAANLVVGAFVGLTGVAGFLLPIVYTGPLAMGVTEGLALSFAAFIVSGALGSVNYKKAGNLDIPFGIRLSIGRRHPGGEAESGHTGIHCQGHPLCGGPAVGYFHPSQKG